MNDSHSDEKAMNLSSLERIYPASGSPELIVGNETLFLHLQRYHFAGKHLRPGMVVDAACGAGYGSYLLATEYGKDTVKVFGVDNSPTAIGYCKEYYSHPMITYDLKDVFDFRPGVPINTIVSLETIEHLSQPERFVKQFSSMLADGGRFIASAPVTPSMDANPFHQSDFTTKSFKNLFLSAGLVEIDSMLQIQKYKASTMMSKKEGRGHDLRKNLATYYLKNPGKFLARIGSLISDGLTNKYLVVAFEKK